MNRPPLSTCDPVQERVGVSWGKEPSTGLNPVSHCVNEAIFPTAGVPDPLVTTTDVPLCVKFDEAEVRRAQPPKEDPPNWMFTEPLIWSVVCIAPLPRKVTLPPEETPPCIFIFPSIA